MNVLITGVGKAGQIGEALAAAFVDAGATLAVVGRSLGDVSARAREAGGSGATAHPFACDLTDVGAVAALADDVARTLGDLDAVVCAAGGFAMSGPVGDSDPTVLAHMLALNLTTAYATTRALLPLLRPRRGALVYLVAPTALPSGVPIEMSAYAASKAAVVALMRAVAAEEEPHGVRANAVALAAVRTAANVAAMGDGASYVERDDVARTVRWLASPESRPISGEIIRLG